MEQQLRQDINGLYYYVNIEDTEEECVVDIKKDVEEVVIKNRGGRPKGKK